MSLWLRGCFSSVWARLLSAVSLIVLISWLVLAVSVYFFSSTQRDLYDLVQTHVPQLALSGELAESASRLAALTTAIATAEGETPRAELRGDLRSAIEKLQDVLKRLDLRQTQNASGASAFARQLEAELAAVLAASGKQRDISTSLDRQLVMLRWLNADIQVEVETLVNDLEFNISSETRALAGSVEASARQQATDQFQKDGADRKRLQQTASNGATVTTLMIQGAIATDETLLAQLEDLAIESLSDAQREMRQLNDTTTLLTLRQSIGALAELTRKETGIFAQRRSWIAAHKQILSSLRTALSRFAELQTLVGQASATQRESILGVTRHSLEQSRRAIRWLLAFTAAAGLAGLAILFGYIRDGIVRPLGVLSAALHDISEGRAIPPLAPGGADEIGRIGNAVEAFRKSVEARDEAHARLVHEVAEREQAMAELRRTQAELVQADKMAALGALSAGISHELNQPLAAMKHRLHALSLIVSRDANANADLAQRIQHVDALAGRMEATIRHLKRFARRSEYKREVIDLGAVLNNSRSLLSARLHDAGIAVNISGDVEGTRVVADEILLEQVTLNLLANAIDAIAERQEAGEQICGQIDIGLARGNGVCELRIDDNGAGLRDLAPQAAFDPFVTTKEVGKGLGLGLSISYNIMKDMGGDLRLAPRPAGGASAIVQLVAEKERDG